MCDSKSNKGGGVSKGAKIFTLNVIVTLKGGSLANEHDVNF